MSTEIKYANFNNYIKNHNCKEVTSSNVFKSKGQIDDGGLLSPDIFGYTPDEKRVTFGYINLGGKFIHPHIFDRVFSRTYREINGVITGQQLFCIINGELEPYVEGVEVPKDTPIGTGIDWLYENYERFKIKKFEENDDDTFLKTRLKKIANLPKEEIFINKWLVLPLIYRDINVNDGSVALDEINDMYVQLLSYVSSLKTNANNMMFDANLMKSKIQFLLVKIHKEFLSQISGKTGQNRKGTMSKNVTYGGRFVITSPKFPSKKFGESPINIDTVGYPLSGVLNMWKPFMIHGMNGYLRTLYENGHMMIDGTIIDDELFETLFNNQTIEEMLNKYNHSWKDRLDLIDLTPERHDDKNFVTITIEHNGKSVTRDITLFELIYIVAYDVVERVKKPALTSRFPIQDMFGIEAAKVHILSIDDKVDVNIGGLNYPHYPDIDRLIERISSIDGNSEEIASSLFNETQVLSNLLLDGFGADFDGDKMANRAVFSNEAIQEVLEKLDNPMHIFDLAGKSNRNLGKDPIQALFSMSYRESNRMINDNITNAIIKDDIDKEYIFNKLKIADTENSKRVNSLYDKVKLPKGFMNLKEPTISTLGRLLINKVIFGHIKSFEYINKPFNKSVIGGALSKLATDVFNRKLSLDDCKKVLNKYEDFAFFITPFITPSFSNTMMTLDPKILKRKEELFEQHKEKIEAGDVDTIVEIEKELIALVKEVYKDDPQMELYLSGSKCKIENEFKKMMLFNGAIPKGLDPSDGFYISKSSLNDGLKKEEIVEFGNYLRIAGYFRARNPQVGGYLGKQSNAIFGAAKLDVHGTDCGSKVYIKEKITDSNYKEFVDRYFVLGDKLVLGTEENLKRMIGRELQFRTPMGCKTENICSKCAGEKWYKLTDVMDKPVPVGLLFNKQSTELTQKSLKKVHDMSLKTKKIDRMEDWIL